MTSTTETIRTESGSEIDTGLVAASGARKGTLVLFMDGFGPRPALTGIAERLAGWGWDVLIPNLYYREPGAIPVDVGAVFVEGDYQARFYQRIAGITGEMVVEDVRAIAAHLEATRGEGEALAAVGYCLGGRYALAFAGVAPGCKFAASIHGARLATDDENSAHRLAASGNAAIHVSVAQIDPTFSSEELDELRRALTEGGRHSVVEMHPGAIHGFALPDLPVHDPVASEDHWAALARFLG
jgi:carboxymethylenebutenolidase